MNIIVCGSDCRYQRDGYCCLEGRAVITNAVSSPCCYYEKNTPGGVSGKERPGDSVSS